MRARLSVRTAAMLAIATVPLAPSYAAAPTGTSDPVLVAAGDVLSGHHHTYERFPRMKATPKLRPAQSSTPVTTAAEVLHKTAKGLDAWEIRLRH
jgi:hypothetical protein